jgi:hypothetical protein
MKRVTQVTLFYLLIAIESNSQVYFNKRVDFYNQNQGAISFIMVDDTFYIPINLLDTHEGVIGKITQLGTTIFTNKYTANFNISYYYPYSIINYKHIPQEGGGITQTLAPLCTNINTMEIPCKPIIMVILPIINQCRKLYLIIKPTINYY